MIARLHDLPLNDLRPLIQESQAEGFRSLRRLQDDWLSGANRFDREGEAFFGFFSEAALVGVGGINRHTSTCGRLRRFYVSRDWRRKGIGRNLAEHILLFSAQFYEEVVLHTKSAAADAFYRALGFSRIPQSNELTIGLASSTGLDASAPPRWPQPAGLRKPGLASAVGLSLISAR
jgi:GNAT superfamily N-acetyltransferase